MKSGGKEGKNRNRSHYSNLSFIFCKSKALAGKNTHSCAGRRMNTHLPSPHRQYKSQRRMHKHIHTHTNTMADYSCKDRAIRVSLGSLFFFLMESRVSRPREETKWTAVSLCFFRHPPCEACSLHFFFF